ncbi:MAG: DUF4019 domain-containing protein [Casimicrobiaceae bacterium]
MQGTNIGRRTMLAALSVWAFASALPATAQDPAITEAHRTALEWMTVVDADNATASYAAASAKFRTAMTPEQWAGALTQARTQFGANQRRTFAGAQRPEEGKNTPQGEFLMIIFRSGFAKRDTVVETVTMERESDKKWRVVGYSLK